MSRVFFHVQHLLGIGHIRRAAVLARTLAASGFDVLLVSGGAPLNLDLGSARFHQLPPVRARDEGLRELSRLDGAPLDEAFKAERTRDTARAVPRRGARRADHRAVPVRPHAAALRAAAVARGGAGAAAPAADRVVGARHRAAHRCRRSACRRRSSCSKSFDLVLIHGDPELIGFERSFAGWDAIRDRAAYTGYVAELDRARTGDAGKDEVIVSAGGGAVGAPLLRGGRGGARTEVRWPGASGDCLAARSLDDRACSRRRRGDRRAVRAPTSATLLRNAALSISQAGYNTVVETLCLRRPRRAGAVRHRARDRADGSGAGARRARPRGLRAGRCS